MFLQQLKSFHSASAESLTTLQQQTICINYKLLGISNTPNRTDGTIPNLTLKLRQDAKIMTEMVHQYKRDGKTF